MLNLNETMALQNAGSATFNNLATKFSTFLYGGKERDITQVTTILDELNSLDYRYPVVTNLAKATLLIHHCCTIISPDDPILVRKCSQLIRNIVKQQNLQIEGPTLSLAIEWSLLALKSQTGVVLCEVLTSLDILLRINVQATNKLLPGIIGNDGPLLSLAQKETCLDVLALAVQCLEACTSVYEVVKGKRVPESALQFYDKCGCMFFKCLTHLALQECNDVTQCKLLISCLKGLKNIITQNQDFLKREVGLLFGVSKVYMLYGIPGVSPVIPEKIMPSTSSVSEPFVSVNKDVKKGGKIAKQRKHRKRNTQQNLKTSDRSGESSGYIPATSSFNFALENSMSALPESKLKTSDSDFSDTENGRAGKVRSIQSRVRQSALNLLYTIVKLLDKHTTFCYWSSLIPDSSGTSQHSLTACILKDPSPRGRIAALNVLLLLLTSSKLYLSQAEHSDRTTAFTPFSVTLGSMINHLHRCLILAVSDTSVPVLTHSLKALGALVQATPYHRLAPGLVTKIVRNVKCCTAHKDATVQVAALIVLGCVLTLEPVIPETKQLLLKASLNKQTLLKHVLDTTNISEENVPSDDDLEYVEFSSDDESVENFTQNHVPWLLETCLGNLGISCSQEKVVECHVPSPVKLESLQVISAMTRNYFIVLVDPHLNLITMALDACLADKYTDLRLHAGRTIDFIGQAMNQHFNNEDIVDKVTMRKGLLFWQTLMSGSLLSLLQDDQYTTLRAVGCDCFGSIGSHVFEQLPRDQQILIVTLLFSGSRDDETNVKAAAIRALAICVLFPSLREDVGFIIDLAEIIHNALKADNIAVRTKASWSLGNLSNALVLNKCEPAIEDIPDTLLLKLLEVCLAATDDNDKISMNVTRALGNLMQLLTKELITQSCFKNVFEQAVDFLVKKLTTGTNMKVRWNSCYAIGNVLKNGALYLSDTDNSWVTSVFSALMDLVMRFRNFKVRINAALALSCPSRREYYGNFYIPVWISLIKALENTESMEDFSEYKHRDQLIEQISLTLGHLATLVNTNDLVELDDIVILHLDTLKLEVHKVLDRVIPEKSDLLVLAAAHLNTLVALPNLNNKQKRTADALCAVFYNEC